MTNQEEENIQENFSMSYTEKNTGGKFLYILIVIVICFTLGFVFFYIYNYLYSIIGLFIMGSVGPSGRTNFASQNLLGDDSMC